MPALMPATSGATSSSSLPCACWVMPWLLFMLILGASAAPRPPIDRETVVARHALRFESSGVDPTAHAAPKLMTLPS